ncbi:Hpt domain-containing protein [Pseudovibrio exalbescens]|uniref:Hpt domain-containing protein n=1 Tax=Pseudovibrio exalbescens TaxID=197461 RepID=UPI0023673FA5|nr:Hpt domain-containing protein [Pseudovibrio exalbescens]MDD7910411.1 Hpt domain-containing protein [Pseudovibrio exalbescens]
MTVQKMDWSHLDRVTFGDASLQKQVLTMFCDQARDFIEQLRVVNASDEAVTILHTLKGSSRGIGANDLADFVEEEEMRCLAGEMIRLDDLFAEIRVVCEIIEGKAAS